MARETQIQDQLMAEPTGTSNETTECCIIDQLISEKSFLKLSFQDQCDIIDKDRPTPDICIDTKTKNYIRHFKTEYYKTTRWLTACISKNKLFCWPCILFEEDKRVWNCSGYCDINNFIKAKTRHEKSQYHLSAVAKLQTFNKSDKPLQTNNTKYNVEVDKNREVMKRLIDVCCLLARQGLSFREHNESLDSPNSGNYVQVLYTLAKNDYNLRVHLENPDRFKCTSKRMQDDLIESIGNLMIDEIKKEIKDAQYVAIMLDETSDIKNISQLSTIFRYVKDGEIQERFVGFSDVSENRSASVISEHVFKMLEEFQCMDKLVAQGYDGAATFSGRLNDLQLLVKMRCPNAMFVHCYAHRLNIVLSQSVDFIEECKPFFKTLNGLPSFFAHATKRMNESIEYDVKNRFPTIFNTKWNLNSKIVNTVYENKLELLRFFNDIVDDSDKWDSDTFIAAIGFIEMFESSEFTFQLEIFSEIFLLTDTLCDILRTKSSDIKYCVSKMKETTSLLEEKRDYFNLIYRKIKIEDDIESPRKRRRDDDTDNYLRLCNEIFDTILGQIEMRFSYLKELSFIELIDFKKFDDFKVSFPDKLFSLFKLRYENLFDFSKLHSELIAVYNLSNFSEKTVPEIIKFLKETELAVDGYPEVYKLCSLILTISVNKSISTFSCLKRVKTSVRKSKGENRLSTLSMISIENKLHEDIQNRKNFYDLVIKKFLKKGDRGITLVHK